MNSKNPPEIATVQVWTFKTFEKECDCEALLKLLSSEEQRHASHLHFASDRARYISAHAGLRQLLACALATSPVSLVIDRGPSGKPYLASSAAPLYFNLSHSGSLASVAISSQVEVGVDIEEKQSASVTADVMEDFLSGQERRWIDDMPTAKRTDTFFAFWTLKEALMKVEGSGVSLPMHKIETIDCISSDFTARCNMPGDAKNSCFAAPLTAPIGYAAAVASVGRVAQVHHTVFPESRWSLWPRAAGKKQASPLQNSTLQKCDYHS